ncbi:helix-turn-helix transcriptional regulator [Streptomyces sp. NA02950]|uniref:ArsR/SmtB family transcription factor n=1 Tax=Streptomyces sp. NA02950 TaxID=2742137 RepID=UPI0020CB0915|nr:metalloregulator ArsR/SmtB family transcription factor [Streptomyces sp. NA02950]
MEQQIDPGADIPGHHLQVFLKALASSTRQQLLRHFAEGAELTVGEVAEQAGIGRSTTSEHLAVLRRGGLLQSTRDGKLVRYRTDKEGITHLLGELQAYLLSSPEPRDAPPSRHLHP